MFIHMGEYQNAHLDAVFGAMADPTRRGIMARLAMGDARVTDVASAFPISLNSVSKHVRMLERANLVTRTVQGRDHVLSLNAEPLDEAAAFIETYRRFWGDRLAVLEALIERRQRKARPGRK